LIYVYLSKNIFSLDGDLTVLMYRKFKTSQCFGIMCSLFTAPDSWYLHPWYSWYSFAGVM